MFSDDSLFCILSSCEKESSICQITNNIYIYQLAGFDINFKYKLPFRNLTSLDLNQVITDTISMGYLDETSNGIKLTILGEELLKGFVGSQAEFDYVNKINKIRDSFSTDELNFICLTNYIVSEVKEKYGVEGLISQKSKIKETLKRLSSVFSEENFNDALSVLKEIRKW